MKRRGEVATAWATREIKPAHRLIAAVALALAPALLIGASVWISSLTLDHVVREGYPLLERAQLGCWIAASIVASLGCLRQRWWRGVLLLWWFAALALLAGLRELDFQVLLNPENIQQLGVPSHWGVRWKPDWWTDSDTPGALRACWALALGAVGALVVLPFACARYPWPARLLKGDPFPWLLGASFALLAAGFALDDFIGRPLTNMGLSVSVVEESVELLACLCALTWVIWLAKGSANLHIH